jgi:hypothetical protein
VAFPQGINFRQTSGYVTDGADENAEIGTSVNYPRTTPQGNTVGFESITGSLAARDRSTSPDPRIAGLAFISAGGEFTYRIDLPAPGTYRIWGGARETIGSALRDTRLDISDNATLLTTAWDRANLVTPETVDATNTIHANGADWVTAYPTSYIDLTFSSTIARFRVRAPTGGADNRAYICHLRIEQLGSAPITGTLAATLADATLSATGVLPITGTLASTLADATLQAEGALPIAGTLAATLADATLSATGALPITGALSATLADATLIATGLDPTVVVDVPSVGGTNRTRRGARRIYLDEPPPPPPIVMPSNIVRAKNSLPDDDEEAWILLA